MPGAVKKVGAKKIAVIIGTRPEAIKLCPVVQELGQAGESIQPVVISTGQHREMLDQVFSIFKVVPDFDLKIMQPNQSLEDIVRKVFELLPELLRQIKPDLVIVQGDTSTAFVAALACFYQKIPVAHVEAGLRTFNKTDPFPEEVNRRLLSVVSDLHFAPTSAAKKNLLAEGISAGSIVITGNTVIDALLAVSSLPDRFPDPRVASFFSRPLRTVIVTAHRRENFGAPLSRIAAGLRRLADAHSGIQIIFPVHPNPNVRQAVLPVLEGHDRILLTDPLDYESFVTVLKKSDLALSDSGGIQEEGPALGKPVLVMRETTERPEGIDAGCCRLVGTDSDSIFSAASLLLTDPEAYRKMARARNPYGDGKAAARIVQSICFRLKLTGTNAEEFAV